jgi:hypothetical protein
MDYEVERLVFVVRSVADGVDKGFKAAEKAASGLEEAYRKAERTEKQLEKALANLRKELDLAQKSGQQNTSIIEKKIAKLEDAKKQLEETTAAQKKQYEEEAKGQASMLASIAIIGAVRMAWNALSEALTESTDAYVKNRNAQIGLRSIAEGTGQSMGMVSNAVQDLISDGLIPLEQASTSLKNLLSRGFSAQEAIDIILRLKDAAAFGRQASYSLADAVMTATEGLKNENSILVDNAGVTKNVAKMWQDYAKQRGITTEAMTLAQKREAEYIGIMEETRHQVGDAAKLSAEFSGTQLALEASTQKLKVAIGEANATGLAPMLGLLNGLTRGAADFAKENQSIVTFGVNFGKTFLIGTASLFLFGTNFKKLIVEMIAASPILSKVTAQFGLLKTAISGPWGWITLGISVLIGVLSAISAESAKAKENLKALNEEAEELSRQANESTSLVARYEELSNNAYRTKEETAEMHQISEKLVSSYGFRADGVSREGALLVTNLGYMKEQLEVHRQLAREKMEEAEIANIDSIKETINNLKDARTTLINIDQRIADAQAKLSAAQAKAKDVGAGEAAGREYASEVSGLIQSVERLKSIRKEAMQTAREAPTEIAEHVERSIVLARSKIGEAAATIPIEAQSAIAQAMSDMAYEGMMVDSETAVGMFEKFMKIDKEAMIAQGIEELTDVRAQIVAGVAASGASGIDGISVVNVILRSLTDDEGLTEAIAKAKELGAKIMNGVASSDEEAAFDELREKIKQNLSDMQIDLEKTLRQARLPVGALDKAFGSLKASVSKTAAELSGTTAIVRAQKTSVKEMISSVSGLAGSYDSLNKEIQDLTDLQIAIDVLKEGKKGSTDYGLALEYLADRYGVSKEQVLESLDTYQADADMKAVMIDLNYQLAIAEAEMAKATALAMVQAGTATQEQADKIVLALDNVLNKLYSLDGASATINVDGDGQVINVTRPSGGSGTATWRKPKRTSRGAKRSSKAQSDKNVALERELALIERKKRLDQITYDEEIALLERARRLYAKTADEREKIDDQLYALRREKETAHVEHLKVMNRLTIGEEIKLLEKRLATYKVGTEAYKEVERELYQARQEQVRRAYEIDVYYGRLTLEQQRERIRAMIREHKEGTEARIELEKQLYDVQQQIKDRDTQNLQRLADGVLTALRARYEAQRQAEEEHIQQSMDNWSEWSQAQREAIEEQIKALDELTKGEDRAEEERKRRRKIAALEQQLQYENDAYNRRKLQEQIAKEQEGLDKWLARNEREDAKEALRQQADEVSKRAEAEQKALQQQLDDLNKFYEDRLKEYKLTAEAEQLIMAGNQKDIINLIQSFAPAYDLVGKSLGERLYEGFASKAMNINTWFESMTKQIESYQLKMAQEANRAATAFWQTHGSPTPAVSPTDHGRPEITIPPIVINYYAEQDSPAKMTRDLERLLERLTRR